MRPRRLAVTAFGPYPGTVDIDFDLLAEDGLFLIHGATGAGKTSLLDAVTYALYGGVAGGRRADRLRSDHADAGTATSVAFEFTLRGEDYRITRTPPHERAKKSGAGTTRQKPKATLSVRRGRRWEPLADGVEEVGRQVVDRIGLNLEQFQQVVVLPQGEVARALRADANDRRRLLSSLFATGRFEQYTRTLTDRARAAEHEVAEQAADVRRLAAQAAERWAAVAATTDEEHTPGELAAAAAATVVRLSAVVDQAAAAQREAALALVAGRVAADRIARQDAARATLRQLEDAAADIATSRARLAAAARAAPLVGSLAAADDAAHAVGEAAARKRAALGRLPRIELDSREAAVALTDAIEAAGAAPADAQAVAAARDALHTAVIGLEQAARDAGELRRLHHDLAQHRHDALRHRRLAQTARDRADDLHRRIQDCHRRRTPLRQAHESLPTLRAEHAQLTAVAGAAVEAVALRAALADATDDTLVAKAALGTALDRHRLLLERRIDGMAAELAADLVDGQPCVVCGSQRHPAPASATAKATTADALHRAAEAVEDRQDSLTRLLAREADLRRALQQQVAAAGAAADDPRAAEAAAREAAHPADAAAAAAALLDEVEAEAAAAAAGAADAAADAAASEGRAAVCDAAAAALGGTIRRLEEAVGRAGGEGADVTQLSRAAREALGGVDELCAAVRDEQRAAAESTRLRARADALVREHGFDDGDAARAAMLDDGSRDRLAATLRNLDDRRAAARATLAETPVPVPTGDPVVLEAACEDAEAALAAAQRRMGVVTNAAEDLRRLARRWEAASQAHAVRLTAADRLRRLADTCNGTGNDQRMSLERYVLAAYFEEIAEAGSLRLHAMTNGRYTLRHSDARVRGGGPSGLSLTVFDAHTGTERDAGSLSGGETFQASLALALAVADVVQRHAGGVALDMLFIDEGFGALDADSLEQALAELDALREGGRLVGIISHVPALRDRIAAGIEVTTGPHGSDARVARPVPV